MADENDLRFTMELKDLFTEVFDKVKDNVESGAATIKANLGGLSKALAVVGVGAAIGTAVFAAWEGFKDKIADVTKEAEKLEVTLGNILGSRGAAKGVLNELANSDLSKVFSIKEIDEGYTTLANHRLKATLAQMKAIGDLSAGTGKDFNTVIDTIVRGGEGRLLTIKQLGIDVTAHKNKKQGIDDLTLSFRGQTQTIKNNAASIREYLMNLGMIPGVQGSMARSADTVAASENNLSNQVTKLWRNLGEDFNPSVIETKTELSKLVGSIADFFAIPAEKKFQDQADKLQALKVQLAETNPKSAEFKGLLQDINDISPDLLKNLDLQKASFEDIAAAIDKGSDALLRQKSLVLLNKDNSQLIADIADNRVKESDATANIAALIASINPNIADSKKTQDQMISEAIRFQNNKIKSLPNGGKVSSTVTSAYGSNTSMVDGEDVIKKNKLLAELEKQNEARMFLGSNQGAMNDFKKKQDALGKMFGLDSVAGAGKKTDDETTGSKTSIDKGGIASVHGGGQIKNVTININHLIDGGVNVHSTTLKEGVTKAVDIVKEGFLTMVNDANLVGN